MTDDPTRFPAPRAAAEDGTDTGTPAPHLLLDIVRRLRARERGYLADLLHDGPIQELAAVPLELAEARCVMRHRRAMSSGWWRSKWMRPAGRCAACRKNSGPFHSRHPVWPWR